MLFSYEHVKSPVVKKSEISSLDRLHSEGIACDDARNNRRQPVLVFRGAANNGPHLRHIEIFEFASQRIHHQLLSHRLWKLGGVFEQSLPQPGGTVYLLAVGQHSLGIDWG